MAQRIKVRIEGSTPMLMNRFRDASISGKTKKQTGVMAKEEIKDKLYLDSEDYPCVPGRYLYGALVESAKNFKIRGKGKSTFSKLVGSTLMVEPEQSRIKGDYEPYSIAAVNPSTKGRMMVTRPRFENWACDFDLLLQDEGIDSTTIKEILDYAGYYVGIGDWRPAKKGMFGKFIVTKFEPVEE